MDFTERDHAELAAKLDARLNGMLLQGLARVGHMAVPDNAGAELARIAIRWFDERCSP